MSHFYDAQGNSCYQVQAANGTMRDTTLRDARKNGWYPSVTTYMQTLAKPGLNTWLQSQILDAVLEFPFNKKHTNEFEWRKEVMRMSSEVGKQASEVGSIVHDALELYFTNGTISSNTITVDGKTSAVKDFVEPVLQLIEDRWGLVGWIPEASFAHSLGFGGKVDLHHPDFNIIIDFKTKRVTDKVKMVCYKEHKMQLGAYRVGLVMPGAELYNLFISTVVPGLNSLVNISENDAFKHTLMFEALVNYWQIENDYFPGENHV